MHRLMSLFTVVACFFLLSCRLTTKGQNNSAETKSVVPESSARNFTSSEETEDVRDFVNMITFFLADWKDESVFEKFLGVNFETDQFGVSSSMFRYFGDALIGDEKKLGPVLCGLKHNLANCKAESNVGFGLCTMRHDPSLCEKAAGLAPTIGFGICAFSTNDINSCDKKGTLGYGLCTAIKAPNGNLRYSPQHCKPQSSVGYALCMSSPSGNESTCAEYQKASMGFGMCVQKNSITSCNPIGSLGYGFCTSVTTAVNQCFAQSPLAFGFCVRKLGNVSSCQKFIR